MAAIARVSSSFTAKAAHRRGLCVFGADGVRVGGGRYLSWWRIFPAILLLCSLQSSLSQSVAPQKITDGVWFLIGDASKARTKLGWEPKLTVMDIAADMVDADIKLFERDRVLLSNGLGVLLTDE